VEIGRMTVVLLDGNRFIDCQSILGYQGRPMLQVSARPLRIELVTPENLPSGLRVRVSQRECDPSNDVRVVATDKSFAIFWREYAVAIAILVETDTVHLKLDLRPLGINIYDDFEALHIGSNAFSRNEVRNAATAINLAD
jgi:hypothetical protein